MKTALYPVVLILVCLSWNPGLAQQCLPKFPDAKGNQSAATSSNVIHGQLIIPQYSFPCDAAITRWEAHIVGSLDDITALYFQVWTFDDHRKLFHRHREHSINDSAGTHVSQVGDKVVMRLDSPSHVLSGFMPGVFIQGNGVRLKFLTNLTVATYVDGTSHFTLIQEDDEHYHRAAPLLWAQLEVEGVPLNRETDSPPTTTPTTGLSANQSSTHASNTQTTSTLTSRSRTHSPPLSLLTTTVHPAAGNFDWEQFLPIIGIAVALCSVLLICFCIVVVLIAITAKLIQYKRKSYVANERQSSPKRTLSPGYSSENCSLSFLPIDSTSRLNLMAFRRQEAARNSGSAPNIISERNGFYQTDLDDMPDSDTYVEIPPRVLVPSKPCAAALGCTSASNPSLGTYSEPFRPPLKENSSYMVLHSADPAVIHLYDEVPYNFRQPYEYEVPAPSTPSCSSALPTPTPHCDDNFSPDRVIYEEI